MYKHQERLHVVRCVDTVKFSLQIHFKIVFGTGDKF